MRGMVSGQDNWMKVTGEDTQRGEYQLMGKKDQIKRVLGNPVKSLDNIKDQLELIKFFFFLIERFT